VWQPKAYTGSYGTNGFHLPFSDNSTAAALGTDTSSNGNTWTVNNISVTAGAGNDSLVDSPTNGSQTDTGVGGEVVGNYATFNPLDNDVIGIALDLDAGTLVFYKNGVSQGTAYSSLSGTFKPAFGAYQTCKGIANFGQRQWAYAAPAGFKALCTTNLPEPTIADGSTAMDVALYTGNGSTQTISGLNFSPDLVWIKSRSNAYSHQLYDVIRGINQALVSNATASEATYANGLSAFNSDGFTADGDAGTNGNTATYAAWTWDAGSSTVTNTEAASLLR
jgi:hypothetical protein